MFLEKVKSEGLAHLSYMVGDGGKAAVIDPRRDCDVYLDMAERRRARITHVFETHRNEDYLVGSTTLAEVSGARVCHGAQLDFQFGNPVSEGDVFDFGNVRLRVLSTPGHTLESISIVLSDKASGKEPVAVFTGDALFVGDVGRTDFYPDRAEEVAGMLYDSVFGKLLPLGDAVIIYPAHAGGSVCGSHLSRREFSTLGYERTHNGALKRTDRRAFVTYKMREGLYMPPWFKRMHRLNYQGPPVMTALPRPAALSPEEFSAAAGKGAFVLDARGPEAFGAAHIPGSLNITLQLLPAFAGWFVPYDVKVALVLEDEEHLAAAVRYLVRLGYDDLAGWLAGGMTGWETDGGRIDVVPTISARELVERIVRGDRFTLLDVRGQDEYADSRLPGATHIYVGELPNRLDEVPEDRPVVTFCSSGARASIAASILRRSGFDGVENCLGSMEACEAIGCPVER